MVSNKPTLMHQFALKLFGIDKADMTGAERRIARLLVEGGFGEFVTTDNGDETFEVVWGEYYQSPEMLDRIAKFLSHISRDSLTQAESHIADLLVNAKIGAWESQSDELIFVPKY